MTARRQFGAAIVACIAGAGLVLLALRQGWARVDYAAPRPLPSGSIPVSGQELLPAAGALALAALACLAAIIATRGLARRVAGVAMAGLGAWIALDVTRPVRAATVIAAASGQAIAGSLGGSLPGGNSAISGGSPAGGALPEIGAASRAVLDSGGWRPVAIIGAAAVIAAGLLAAWRGPRWAVMSARFDRQAQPPVPDDLVPGRASVLVASGPPASPWCAATPDSAATPGSAATAASATPSGSATSPGSAAAPGSAATDGSAATAASSTPSWSAPAAGTAAGARPGAPAGLASETGPAGPAATAGPAAPSAPAARGAAEAAADEQRRDRDAAALWEALDRGVDLTDTAEGETEPAAAPARGEEQ